MARFAVSVVTCRHAEMRMPLSGWFLINSLRMLCSTGMDWLAHSMRRLPRSASSRLLISYEIWGAAVVDMFSLRECPYLKATYFKIDHPIAAGWSRPLDPH